VRSLRAPISKWWYYGAALLAVLLCWLVLDSVAQRQAVDLVTRGVTH
jgi:hypothetical protein